MVIYTPTIKDGYEFCQPDDDLGFDKIGTLINGVRRARSWEPIKMNIVSEDQGAQLLESNSPWLGTNALVFDQKTVRFLGHIFTQYGELLSVKCHKKSLLLYNVTNLVNALNEEESSITRFSSGKIMYVKKYVFREETIQNVDIFKLSNLRISPIFVTQRIVNAWRDADLKGLEFIART